MSSLTLVRSFIESRVHERMSREKILRLQEKRFRKMLGFAYKKSGFYNKLYRSNGITEKKLLTVDIEDIPVVDKDMIMDNFDDVVTTKDVTKREVMDFLDRSRDPNELFKNRYHVVHTSGSSGRIGVFVYSRRDWDSFFPYITKTFDFRFIRSKSAFLGAAGGHYAGVSFSSWTSKGIMRFFCKPLILDIRRPIDEHVRRLNDFQPDILGGYFTGLKILAEQQERGFLDIHPRFLVNCGEGIKPGDKEYIENIFGLPLVNLYGVAECVILGVGKDEYNGIYLMDDLALVEIKNDHILLTNLFNKTQPLIRYRIDDYLIPKEDSMKMLPFTLVDNVIGRDEMVIWLENEKGEMDFIHPLVIAEFYVKGLDRLQIVLRDKKSFDFLAVIRKEEEKDEVIEKIRKKLDDILADKGFSDVRYSVKVVDELMVDRKTGKFKLIVKKEKKEIT